MPTRQNSFNKKLGTSGKNTMMEPLGSETRNKPSAGQNLPQTHSKPIKRFRGTTSQGAKVMGLHADVDQMSGPGDPPEGFVGGTTSKSEWYIYWALERVLGPEEEGAWSYQNSMLGGRSTRGGAVVDFVINMDPMFIGIRVQTYQFHLVDTSYQKTHDREQLFALSDWNFEVVDIHEHKFIHDETGSAAIQVVLAAIRRQYTPDPLGTGYII